MVVNGAGDGVKHPPLVPLWGPDVITLQPVGAGFPCFGAALAGYSEATRDDEEEKNRLCPPSGYGNSLRQWAVMWLQGMTNVRAYSAAADMAEWANTTPLNPSRIPAEHLGTPELDAVIAELGAPTPRRASPGWQP